MADPHDLEVLRMTHGLLDALQGPYPFAATAEFAQLGPQVMRDLLRLAESEKRVTHASATVDKQTDDLQDSIEKPQQIPDPLIAQAIEDQLFVSGQMDAQGSVCEKWKIGSGGTLLAISRRLRHEARAALASSERARQVAERIVGIHEQQALVYAEREEVLTVQLTEAQQERDEAIQRKYRDQVDYHTAYEALRVQLTEAKEAAEIQREAYVMLQAERDRYAERLEAAEQEILRYRARSIAATHEACQHYRRALAEARHERDVHKESAGRYAERLEATDAYVAIQREAYVTLLAEAQGRVTAIEHDDEVIAENRDQIEAALRSQLTEAQKEIASISDLLDDLGVGRLRATLLDQVLQIVEQQPIMTIWEHGEPLIVIHLQSVRDQIAALRTPTQG